MNESYFLGNAQDIGQEVQLLVDDCAFEDRWDVQRQLNIPARHPRNPVLVPDRPWEATVSGPSVLYDAEEGTFRMWYLLADSEAHGHQYGTNHWDPKLHGYPYMISYAESSDGVTWTKPLLEKHSYRGFDRTNIVLTGRMKAQGFRVIHTPEPVRELGRFMIVFRDNLPDAGGNQLLVFFSSNGIDWTPFEENPIYSSALDTEHNLVYDGGRGRWLLYTRPNALSVNKNLLAVKENIKTRIAVAVSEDLKNWGPTREVLCPDELDGPFFFDHMLVEKYGNQFLGFLAIQPRDGDAKGHLELVSSPDGLQWRRSGVREPFLGPGSEGDWDGGHVWLLKNIVPVGDWLYLYYGASQRPWRCRFPENPRAIGLARIRRDRFAGQFAGVGGGFLLSREVKVAGNRLLINCCPIHGAFTRKHGATSEMKVELLDSPARPIPGYTFDDCDSMRVDSLAHPVSWRGKADISALRDQSVYIRFFIRSAYLFAFRFAE